MADFQQASIFFARLGYLIPWYLKRQGHSIPPVAKKSPHYPADPALLALGKAVRHFRLRAGLSQEALALEADIDRSYLGGIERGEHNVAVINLVKLSTRLGMSLAALMKQAGL